MEIPFVQGYIRTFFFTGDISKLQYCLSNHNLNKFIEALFYQHILYVVPAWDSKYPLGLYL